MTKNHGILSLVDEKLRNSGKFAAFFYHPKKSQILEFATPKNTAARERNIPLNLGQSHLIVTGLMLVCKVLPHVHTIFSIHTYIHTSFVWTDMRHTAHMYAYYLLNFTLFEILVTYIHYLPGSSVRYGGWWGVDILTTLHCEDVDGSSFTTMDSYYA